MAPPKSRAAVVYFDGGCPVCAREIALYRRADSGDRVQWLDISPADAPACAPDLDRATAMARLHVRDEQGRLHVGGPAFLVLWRALPRWRRWTRWLDNAAGRLLLSAGYAVFLRLRRLWRGAGRWPA
ncbi:thiol-disulfide oxidoreductase DCC family protein [Roseateles sp.]|uniref:thiol-disulfide oxidoreductase DCC family protein n=1 Tax=Roseateles sp. TaxID=1971397 RepID=UPI003BAC7678